MKHIRMLSTGLVGACCILAVAGCGEDFAISGQTVGLVRLVRPGVHVSLNGSKRAVMEDTRLIREVRVNADETGRAILELDSGARIIVDASSEVAVTGMDTIELVEGRIWMEASEGEQMTVTLADWGELRAATAAASVVLRNGKLDTYSASGEVTYDLAGGSGLAREGEILEATRDKTEVLPARLWTDWTGGLAEAGPQGSDTPTGIGEIFARKPGSLGVTRLPLVIRRHDVRVTVQGDLAITETVQEFFNPASETLEGVYKLRIPEDSVLQRFAVDRDGRLVDGYIKEREKARADYQSHVYEGSTDDPALLEWIAPGTFKARIYPIKAGEVRIVAYRYVQWLRPSGDAGDKRTYVLPMGSAGVAPLIGEFSLIADLEDVGTKVVQAGLGARVEEGKVVFSASDFRPKSDFWLELIEVEPDLDGKDVLMATRTYDADEWLLNESGDETYFFTQFLLRPDGVELAPCRDLRVAVVSDLSAATDPGLADLGLTFVDSFLRQLDEEDSVAVLAGDLDATMMGTQETKPVKATAAVKESAIDALSRRSTGGATDIGQLITEAAEMVGGEPGGIVVYVGDAFPTVGEMDLAGLLERLSKLPHAVRLYGVALGDESNADLLAGLCTGSGMSTRVSSRIAAAETAYRILADASVPVFTDVTFEVEGEVERLYPRQSVTLRVNEPLGIIGRITGEEDPEAIRVKGKLGDKKFETRVTLHVTEVNDRGDLRLRWATRRLEALQRADAGREALVELGTRYQIITPYTSFYVPPASEATHLPARPPFEIFVMPEDQQGDNQAPKKSFVKRVLFGAAGMGLSLLPYGCSMQGRDKPLEEAPEAAEQSQQRWAQTDQRASGDETAVEPGSYSEGQRGQDTPQAAPMDKSMGTEGKSKSGGGMFGIEGPAMEMEKKEAAGASKKADRKPSIGRELEDPLSGILSALGAGGGGTGYRSKGGDLDDLKAAFDSEEAPSSYDFGSTWISDEEAQQMTTGEAPESLQGTLDSVTVKSIADANAASVRACYEDQLAIDPLLEGRVNVKLVVGSTGSVIDTDVMSSTLESGAVESCILAEVRTWTFPVPEAAGVSVATVPFNFKQGSEVKAEQSSFDNFGLAANELNLKVQMSQKLMVQQNEVNLLDNNANFLQIAARKTVCTVEANKPLADRVEVWRERLGTSPSVGKVVSQFNQARRNCEIRSMQDRRAFARLALSLLDGPESRCQFMNRMQVYPDLVDYIRKKILETVTTPEEMSVVRMVCDDATLASQKEIQDIIGSKKTEDEKIKAIKKLIKIYPTDMDLKILLLGLLEDAADSKRLGEARRLADELRHHPYADDRVRTRVGEFYMRIDKKDEAKRCFSEIVEFAPFSPAARRRLGDLYRTYGWHEDAYRQYETLSVMVPADETVLILMAEAAALAGRLDEAVRLAERVSQTAGSGGPLTAGDVARILNGLRLTKLRVEARKDGDEKKVKDLMKRSRRAGVLRDAAHLKVLLVWSHPDVLLDLMVKDAGSEIRGADSLASDFGVQWLTRTGPQTGDILLHVVRSGQSVLKESRATLYVILDEGEENETIVEIEVELGEVKTDTLAWLISPDGTVTETKPVVEKPIGTKEVTP